MTDTPALDIQHFRSWIGREEEQSDLVAVDLVRKFNAMLELPADTVRDGQAAPVLIHYCLAQPAAPMGGLGEDGHPARGGFLPPLPLPRRMWAGSSLVFHDSLRVGDRMRRVSRIADVAIKEGRSGILCFVTVEHRIDVDGKVVIEETQIIVYRDAATPKDAVKPVTAEPAPASAHQKPIEVSTPLLFRYSALTFNGHRIHYDRNYATTVEYYPGLVFHGPLQATLLLNYATELKGSAPDRFTFRGLSPLFDDDRISLHAAQEEDGRMKLWTARENGPVAMSAEAVWS